MDIKKNLSWSVSSLGSIQCTFMCYLVVWLFTAQPKVDKGLLQCYTKNEVCLCLCKCNVFFHGKLLLNAMYNV